MDSIVPYRPLPGSGHRWRAIQATIPEIVCTTRLGTRPEEIHHVR